MRRTKSSLFILALAFAAHASAPERGRVLAIHSGRDAQDSFVYVLGDRPLSFTTLKLGHPPRVVVDFADAEIVAEDRELSVADGAIERVGLAAAGARTARLVIELAQDAEFDVRAVESRVEVRVPRGSLESGSAGRAQAAPAAAVVEAPDASGAEESGAPRDAAGAETASEAQKRASLPNVALVGPHEMQKPSPEPHDAGVPDANLQGTDAGERAAPPAPARSAGAERKVARDGQRHSITGIGFRPVRGGEVIVRSDHPLEYGVSGDTHAVLLHLRRAAIPLPNNRRPLDTRFFDGPVQRVVPVVVADGTDVRIELKSSADYHLEQSGSVLIVTFAQSR